MSLSILSPRAGEDIPPRDPTRHRVREELLARRNKRFEPKGDRRRVGSRRVCLRRSTTPPRTHRGSGPPGRGIMAGACVRRRAVPGSSRTA
jgi:hypothetical protein